MNLRDLEYALAVQRHASFTRAADACGVSQPTLSAQIRKLEGELEVRLFERDGHRIRVTPAGSTILDYARTVCGAAADLVDAARAARDPFVGTLRVGVIPTLAPYLLPLALPAARAALPQAPLAVSEETTAVLGDRLAAGELDAAILATADPGGRFVEAALFDEPLFVAVPRGHRLAALAAIPPSALEREPLLLLADGHCLRDHALALCAQPPAAQAHDMRAASLETLLHLVEAGHGVTVIPALCRATARIAASTIETRPFDDPSSARTVRLAYRRESPRRSALDALAAAIRGCVSARS